MEALEKLKEIKEKYPYLRLCQIISNAITYKREDIFYITDEYLLDVLINWEKRFEEKDANNSL